MQQIENIYDLLNILLNAYYSVGINPHRFIGSSLDVEYEQRVNNTELHTLMKRFNKSVDKSQTFTNIGCVLSIFI